jgi:hypothetical protein
MIVSYSITKDQKPTPEQIAEIREAAKRPIVRMLDLSRQLGIIK